MTFPACVRGVRLESGHNMSTEKRVKAADRTLDLFEAFRRSGRPMNLSELAHAMGMPVSSCHVLVATLISRGYLCPVGTQRAYYPTRVLFDLASDILSRDPILGKVTVFLESLRDKSGETVVLAKRLGKYVFYVDVLESLQTIRFSSEVSVLRSLHSSALGKALLGRLPLPERIELIESLDLQRVTANTISSARRLLADVAAGEVRGWHMTRGESVDDVGAVARAVPLGGEDYAVAIAGPLSRMEPAMERHARLLTATSAKMVAATG